MGRKTINRIGEKGVNNFGSEMVIVEYRKWNDVDVYFPEYDWTFEHARYDKFKNGNIMCPYEPRYYGVGCLGEGKYKVRENGKIHKYYKIWYNMLTRCYDPRFHETHSTYKGCTVEECLLNFQYMAEWIENNYYEVQGEVMCLDKDILCKGNKTYSRDKCIFVPERINLLFTKSDKTRGDNPIGVTPRESGNYRVFCNNGYGKNIYLGTYPTKEEAFNVYKDYKENLIKKTINSYEGKIPEPFYSRLKIIMYDYKVEIDD